MKNNCYVCGMYLNGKDYKVISLRGVNHSSDTAVNGVRICKNCLKSWTPDGFTGEEKKNGIEAKITVNFKKLTDNARQELRVSHFINDTQTDWMNGTGSIKRTMNKLSKMHYGDKSCTIDNVIVEICINGSKWFNVYKPNELKNARLALLDRAKNREEAGFIQVV